MNQAAQIEKLTAELSHCRELMNEYLQQRNAERQRSYDLAGALEYWRIRTGLPLEQEKLMKVMDRARGLGGYEWPEGVRR